MCDVSLAAAVAAAAATAAAPTSAPLCGCGPSGLCHMPATIPLRGISPGVCIAMHQRGQRETNRGTLFLVPFPKGVPVRIHIPGRFAPCTHRHPVHSEPRAIDQSLAKVAQEASVKKAGPSPFSPWPLVQPLVDGNASAGSIARGPMVVGMWWGSESLRPHGGTWPVHVCFCWLYLPCSVLLRR